MGKLHTLRRAIERDPESFIYRNVRNPLVRPVYRCQGNWHPRSYMSAPQQYRAFVRKVLRDLGYVV